MKRVLTFICDGDRPTDEEIKQCVDLANEGCIVQLKWLMPYSGWHELLVEADMTIDDCKRQIPKTYGI